MSETTKPKHTKTIFAALFVVAGIIAFVLIYLNQDDIKALKTGKAFFLSRDTGQHCKLDILKPF